MIDRRKFLASAGVCLFPGCAALSTDDPSQETTVGDASDSGGTARAGNGLWRSARGDKRNTGTQETAKFEADIPRNDYVGNHARTHTSPVVDETHVYFTSEYDIHAISHDGYEIDWEKETRGLGNVSPLVTSRSLIVQAGSALIGLDTNTGEERWEVDLGRSDKTSNLIANKGAIFANSADGILRVSPDGTIEWESPLPEYEVHGLGHTGDYVIATTSSSETGKVIALGSDSGEVIWESEHIDCVTEPVLGQTRAYVVAKTGTVHALSLDSGERQWTIELDGGSIRVPPALDTIRNQLVVPSGSTGNLVAIDIESPTKRWQTSVASTVRTSPGVTLDAIYHCGSAFRRIDPDSGEVDLKDPNLEGTGGLALTEDSLWAIADNFLIKVF
jgi:outer membrane protein assembly factor BamB